MSDQWRYETFGAEEFASPAGNGALDEPAHGRLPRARGAARLAALVPDLRPQPARRRRRGARRGPEPAEHVVRELREDGCGSPARTPTIRELSARPDALARQPARLVEQGPRVLPAPHPRRPRTPPSRRAESAPEQRPARSSGATRRRTGKLDLFTTIDFRMNGSCVYSDVVLPAATWYEKHDLSSTDLHPFVHPFNAAIPPPWEAKTDWDAFNRIAERFSRLAAKHLGTRTDIVAAPLLHDTPEELAQPLGRGARLARGRVRAGARAHDAEARRGRARLRGRAREDDRARAARGAGGDRRQGDRVEARAGGRRARPAATARCAAARRAGGRRCAATSTCARRSSRCRARPTAGSRSRASGRSRSAPGRRSPTIPEDRADERLTFAEVVGPAAQGDRLGRVVGARVARAPLLALHRERRAL